MKVGVKVGDLPLFVWCMLTLALKMNISLKLQKLGLSNKTREEILRDIFSKPKDPLWKESFQFQERFNSLMKKWEDFEGTERHRKPQFSLYFENQYFHDLRNKTYSSVVQQLDEDPYSQCYGKIYWYFSVVVIRNIFIRKFSHLTIPSPFISVNQKMYKNHSSFWNRFLLLLAFIICTCLSALLLFITSFFR